MTTAVPMMISTPMPPTAVFKPRKFCG
jgi:hypothetical protein